VPTPRKEGSVLRDTTSCTSTAKVPAQPKLYSGLDRVDPSQQLYTICDLAILHGLSRRTVTRLYENEPGVQVLQASRSQQRRIGRRYRTIRVPRQVYLRVKHRMEVA
jgi:hypothetical protein